MFSYRHAFHAGNHADVLKHTTLIAVLEHLRQKDTALLVIDTHAGAGLYRLDGDYAATSGEAQQGVLRFFGAQAALNEARAPALQAYLDVLGSLNALSTPPDAAQLRIYPGSPFIIQPFLGGRDRLKLFELHPTDAKSLQGNIEQLQAGRHISVAREDGFEALKTFLPPPARRALVLCDPSYELKSDYARVSSCIADALKRFATGTYVIWYPIIPRPEAHDLPRKLKSLASKAGRQWLHATLTVKSSKLTTDTAGEVVRPGLPASGMLVINPPHTLRAQLQAALPQMVAVLGQDRHAGFALEAG